MDSSNNILASAVAKAMAKMADSGVEGCSTKDIILVTFGNIMLSGGLVTCSQFASAQRSLKKFGWGIISVVISTLLAIVLSLLFVGD